MKRALSISRDEGFTLIEIMITLVILSIGLLALAGLQISAIKGNTFSRRMTTAVIAAEQAIEQIRNTPYSNVQSESPSQVMASNMSFNRQVDVTDNTGPLANTKTVQVTVTWSDAGKSYSVPVSTIISPP